MLWNRTKVKYAGTEHAIAKMRVTRQLKSNAGGTGERERGEVWSSWSARMDPTFKDCHVAGLWSSSTCAIFRGESVEQEFTTSVLNKNPITLRYKFLFLAN